MTNHTIEPGITEYHFRYIYDSDHAGELMRLQHEPLEDKPFISLHICNSMLGLAGIWKPDNGLHKNFTGDWAECFQTNLSHSAPVLCLFDYEGNNGITLALSEINRNVLFSAGVHEETGEFYTDLTIYLPEQVLPHHLRLRIDQRPLPFDQVLREVSTWWDSFLPEAPLAAPLEARLPMYSTWYSYHQDMTASALLEECKIASDMGMKAIIVDDGWQTSDNHRGYGYCGDWHAEASKFPDFTSYVEQIHALGMKCILWYSIPFVGIYSHVWEKYRNYCLHYDPVFHAGILDPRYPVVRQYLIDTYKDALLAWNLDGFKLDFIDSFRSYPDTPPFLKGMDYMEIQEAVYHLMLDIRYTLTDIKPDLLIEFRQNYIGPQIRRFGNFFRVGDCPLSGITNRVCSTDLKLLCGSSPVHSDMILWHRQEAPEDVAIQLINCIFTTMQISVKLTDLPALQERVLRHYLDFSIQYRTVLQQGDFKAGSPLELYSVLQAYDAHTRVIAVYASDKVLDCSDSSSGQEIWLLNGTHSRHQYVHLSEDCSYTYTLFDCCGTAQSQALLKPHEERLLTLETLPGGSIQLLPH
jgi:alpha-galactosidase